MSRTLPVVGESSGNDCSCGNHYCLNEANSSLTATSTLRHFGDSFVHLPLHHVNESPAFIKPLLFNRKHEGSLENNYRLLQLLGTAANHSLDPPQLCSDCVERVSRAMVTDIQRITNETNQYATANQNEEWIEAHWKLAIQMADEHFITTNQQSFNRLEVAVETRRNALATEIHMLHEACRLHEEEATRLTIVLKDQALLENQLDDLVCAIDEDFSTLELQVRVFNIDQELLVRTLADRQDRVRRLCSTQVQLLPVMYRLQTDNQRGLRYPLINELRLVYRPKGDVKREEIRAGWSLAAQLLLAIATSFSFQSTHWRIVPLSHCAKILYYPLASGSAGACDGSEGRLFEAHTLGEEAKESKSLMTWNALLHAVVQHVMIIVHDAVGSGLINNVAVSPLYYDISPTKVGDIDLEQLSGNDDAGWSRAIHYMTSDLRWLLECLTDFMAMKTLLVPVAHAGVYQK
ncbi:hypothetical protein MPSEU_000366900 [Mayamaea pseudoterrestris]|nr:hypothetical protein MPSEU_000366900 [Mayamaea pseudoterrestris]